MFMQVTITKSVVLRPPQLAASSFDLTSARCLLMTHVRHWQAMDASSSDFTAYVLGSSVNSSWGCATPRSAYRPTEIRRRLMSPTLANADDIRTG
jgi:hypothetical protein